jgi:hypothetical protein
LPSVPVTGEGVVSVDAVSGVNRVLGSIPPGGTSGGAELDGAAEGVVPGGAVLGGPAVQAVATNGKATAAANHRMSPRMATTPPPTTFSESKIGPPSLGRRRVT